MPRNRKAETRAKQVLASAIAAYEKAHPEPRRAEGNTVLDRLRLQRVKNDVHFGRAFVRITDSLAPHSPELIRIMVEAVGVSQNVDEIERQTLQTLKAANKAQKALEAFSEPLPLRVSEIEDKARDRVEDLSIWTNRQRDEGYQTRAALRCLIETITNFADVRPVPGTRYTTDARMISADIARLASVIFATTITDEQVVKARRAMNRL